MSNRYNTKIIQRTNVNGYGLEIEKIWARTEPEEDAYFVVHECNLHDDFDEPDQTEFETEAEAVKYCADRNAELQNTPNWDAQAAYDEEHGTINGQDPAIEAYHELVGEY